MGRIIILLLFCLSLNAQVFRDGDELIINGEEFTMVGDLLTYYTAPRGGNDFDSRYPEMARSDWNNIQDYAIAFVRDALYNQHEIDGLEGSISTQPRASRQSWVDNPNIRATSYASCSPGFNIRYVEEDWNSNVVFDKILTTYHELGHALLRRNHKCVLEDGFTIMRGTPISGLTNYGWQYRRCPSGVPPASRSWIEMEKVFWNQPTYLPCRSTSKTGKGIVSTELSDSCLK